MGKDYYDLTFENLLALFSLIYEKVKVSVYELRSFAGDVKAQLKEENCECDDSTASDLELESYLNSLTDTDYISYKDNLFFIKDPKELTSKVCMNLKDGDLCYRVASNFLSKKHKNPKKVAKF